MNIYNNINEIENELNPNSLVNGDCLEVMKLIKDKSIDMILCDLPYGTTACKWDTIIPFDKLWEQYERIIKDNGAIVLTGSEPFSSALRLSNLKMYKYDWVWNKITAANFMNIKNRPFKTHENVLIFSKTAKFTFNPERVLRSEKSLKRGGLGTQRTVTKKGFIEHINFFMESAYSLAEDGKKHPIDIVSFSTIEKGRYKIKHPTKKPIALFEYLIKTYTNENELVLDNCFGSNTTGVACKNLNRNYIGIEKDKNYFDLGVKRLNETLL
jgi:site-specific DNA-methyltransferase (adenine-specific)